MFLVYYGNIKAHARGILSSPVSLLESRIRYQPFFFWPSISKLVRQINQQFYFEKHLIMNILCLVLFSKPHMTDTFFSLLHNITKYFIHHFTCNKRGE